ncbi:MAG: hypothetical protein OSA97_18195 [Nevskia sp.]|nr:hypothetical protein [Nevskia sp.]
MKGLGIPAVVALCAPLMTAQAQPPAAMDSELPAAAKSYVFDFRQTSKDACVLQKGTIVFDAGGNGTLHLATMTTGNDDVWKSRVRLRNVAGVSVFTSPELNSPRMENQDGHPQTVNWSYSFHVDPTLLPSVTSAEMFDIRC